MKEKKKKRAESRTFEYRLQKVDTKKNGGKEAKDETLGKVNEMINQSFVATPENRLPLENPRRIVCSPSHSASEFCCILPAHLNSFDRVVSDTGRRKNNEISDAFPRVNEKNRGFPWKRD